MSTSSRAASVLITPVKVVLSAAMLNATEPVTEALSFRSVTAVSSPARLALKLSMLVSVFAKPLNEIASIAASIAESTTSVYTISPSTIDPIVTVISYPTILRLPGFSRKLFNVAISVSLIRRTSSRPVSKVFI